MTNENYRPIIKNINSEIDNLNLYFEVPQSYRDIDLMTTLLINRDYPEIKDDADLYEILDQLAKNESELPATATQDQIEENRQLVFSDHVLQVERIDKDSNLFSWLLDWYGRPELGADQSLVNLQHYVRSYYANYQAMYYVHGIGYDSLETDVLGGQLNSENAFYAYLNDYDTVDYQNIRNQWLKQPSNGDNDVE